MNSTPHGEKIILFLFFPLWVRNPISTKFTPWVVGWTSAFFLSAAGNYCICNISAAKTPLRNPHSMAGMSGLILSPLSSQQSQAIPQQKAKENYYQHRILDDNSPSFPGCTVALKNFLSVCIWWTLSITCSSLGFYTLSAWHILWACASSGALLVTPHLFPLSAPPSLGTTWECF